MDRIPRDHATSNVLAWSTHCANVEASADEEGGADADEPPDQPTPSQSTPTSPACGDFKRAPVRRGSEHHESLLTKALQSQSEEDMHERSPAMQPRRKRSITSNFSLASTTDLTCDTGITTPARTNSPSPSLSNVGFTPLAIDSKHTAPVSRYGSVEANPAPKPVDSSVQALEKKRCISFACAAKPRPDDKALMPPPPKPAVVALKPAPAPAPQETGKRTSIKFACPAPPPKTVAPCKDSMARTPDQFKIVEPKQEETPVARKHHRGPSVARSLRTLTPRRSSQSPVAVRSKKHVNASSQDLQLEGARFHEFACGEPQDDDWIRNDDVSTKRKITIDDTLEKENAIRKLAKEAEEEAELEEEDLDEENDGDADVDDAEDAEDGDDQLEEDEEDEGLNDNDVKHESDEDDEEGSDGYNTDNEVGFADSDDEDDDLVLWTTGGFKQSPFSGATPVNRRSSLAGDQSDSSICSKINVGTRRSRTRARKAIPFRPGTPELPDSTDFVCGTLDEDRPMEEAYLSCMAARKLEQHRPIPQDIDPSFPTSDPEDEAEELYKYSQGESDDELWLHGELEDIHHDQGRLGRNKKVDNPSPKRCRSPPPKRLHSPPPKGPGRGRSPKRVQDQPSPRRLKSPPPPRQATSPGSSIHARQGIAFKAPATRPGLTHTKSLPKPPALFPQAKTRRARSGTVTKDSHVRGAIDIVKGLEQKRQRRKEKFYQKYCNRARKDKVHDRRPPPGQGAERMREIGLLVAGKIGQGKFVISV